MSERGDERTSAVGVEGRSRNPLWSVSKEQRRSGSVGVTVGVSLARRLNRPRSDPRRASRRVSSAGKRVVDPPSPPAAGGRDLQPALRGQAFPIQSSKWRVPYAQRCPDPHRHRPSSSTHRLDGRLSAYRKTARAASVSVATAPSAQAAKEYPGCNARC